MARCLFVALAALSLLAAGTRSQRILNDARDHPAGDGSFGFAYNTEDGIAHIARGVPGGAVHGTYSYTDPTGLKVNYNYNAGRQALSDPKPQQQQGYRSAPPLQEDYSPRRPAYAPVQQMPMPYAPPRRYYTPEEVPAAPRYYTRPQNNRNSIYDYNTNY